jgi:DNA-binding CsgD family transcriptional regulator
MTDKLARTRHAAGLLVLDRLPFSLIAVDDRLRPVVMTATAQAAVADARVLRLRSGVLRAVDPAGHAALRVAVDTATTPVASWLSSSSALRLPDGTTSVPVLVLPLAVSIDPILMHRGMALLVFGAANATPHRELLRVMHGLTARECDLACVLMEGRTIAEAAAALTMTVATARTHLQRLMQKTATTRQSELLRILLESGV